MLNPTQPSHMTQSHQDSFHARIAERWLFHSAERIETGAGEVIEEFRRRALRRR